MSAPAPVFCQQCHHSSPAGTLVCPVCKAQTGSQLDNATQGIDLDVVSAAHSGVAIKIGDVIGGRYEIVSLLGAGGMGAVYKANDRDLGRTVAIKVIRTEFANNPEMLQRFKQEIILARQISHKNVTRIYDLGTSSGLMYISMEYVEGEDLATHIERSRISVDESVRIMRQILAALDAAHSEGIIHRDLKPQNILLSPRGKASVMDFGLARSLEQPGVTRAGVVLGTPHYMSPEQAEGRPADIRSDLFAAGIIFYQMLTGVIPFQAETTIASLLKRIREKPVDPREIDPSIPAALSEIVLKCLATDPANRYQNAVDILADLDAARSRSETIAHSVVSAAPAPAQSVTQAIPQVNPPATEIAVAPVRQRRKPWFILACALVLVSLTGFAIWRWKAPSVRRGNKAVTVLVADFVNSTGESSFDGTLEPMFNFAVEGAGFITTYNRAQARKLAGQLGYSSERLDEGSARLIGVREGLHVVVSGSLSKTGAGYEVKAKAVDAVSGKTISTAEVTASSREAVLSSMPELAIPIRTALGDATPASAQLAEGETFTAGSLEAAHEYAVGQDMMLNGNFDKARTAFAKAIEMDSNFGRAYASMAVASLNLGQKKDGEKYLKLAMSHLDRMTVRERYRTRGAYYIMSGDQQKCVEEYKSLVTQFPSDIAGHNNLALCYTQLRMMPQAVEEIDRAIAISPKHAMFRNNLALFSAYGGDFEKSQKNALAVQQLNPSYAKSYLALAFAQLGRGEVGPAATTYDKLNRLAPPQASVAASALADLAVYEGRFGDAVKILEKAASDDIAAGNDSRAAAKFAMLAYAQLSRGQKRPALSAAERAASLSNGQSISFLAARIFAAGGEPGRARVIADRLAGEVNNEAQAYAKLIYGQIAMAEGKPRNAIKTATEANRMLDTWIGHFDAGMAYLQSGALAEADSEFDLCIRRRGEALALFLDESPTFGYYPPVYYWLGRVREALQSSRFADSYLAYSAIRGKAGEDPLLADIHKRTGK